MSFASPLFLLLLPLVGLVPLAWRYRLSRDARSARFLPVALRCAMLLLIVLALAGLRWHRPSGAEAVLFLIDRSESIGAAARQSALDTVSRVAGQFAPGTRSGMVAFAGGPQLISPLATRLEAPPEWPEALQPDETNAAGAVNFASSIFPAGTRRHLVLLSDGNFTAGDALAAARQAADRGVALDVWPLANPEAPEVMIERLEAPPRVREQEPFNLVAHLQSSVATKVTARLSFNQFAVTEKTVEIAAGRSEITFPNLTLTDPLVNAEVELLPETDTRLENNRASAAIVSQGKPRVLIVDGEPEQIRPLAAALDSQGFDAQIRPVGGLPGTMEDLQQFDIFLLSDVSALSLSQSQMELYRSWVQDFGGGFAMLGGENSFGVGGYYGTSLAQMLPVRMEHDDRLETPTVALLIVLDRSGSMSAPVGETTKMALASQGAVFALEALQSRDSFGVLAVDTQVRPIQPLGPLANPAEARSRILSLTAGGGGIYVFTSLLESFRQLRETNASIKHVILFSDARDAEEKNAGEHSDGTQGGGTSFDIVAGMLANRITTSVVALGEETDQDVEFLKQLALRGNGRFYLTNDARTLPQIFSTETLKVAQSSLLEEPFLPVVAQAGPAIAGLDWAAAPLLLGYNATKAKPTADVLLATERGDPLLATWQAGLGRVAVFTSDAKNRWAGEWLNWGGYGQFWGQLCRSLQSRQGRSPLQIRTTTHADGLDVTIDAATAAGDFLEEQALIVSLSGAGVSTQRQTAEQTAPGRYEARFEGAPTKTSTIAVGSAGNEFSPALLGLHFPLAAEYRTLGTDRTALAAVAAAGRGRLLNTGDEQLSEAAAPADGFRSLQPWLLGAALLLLPCEIWLRRRL